MKELTAQDNTGFKVVEGSNYKVVMTYERTEVIDFEHFKRLANAIFKSDVQFVTVNTTIVQVKDIRLIEPTRELTSTEKKSTEATKKRIKYLQEQIDYHEDQIRIHRENYIKINLQAILQSEEAVKALSPVNYYKMAAEHDLSKKAYDEFKERNPEKVNLISSLQKELKELI